MGPNWVLYGHPDGAHLGDPDGTYMVLSAQTKWGPDGPYMGTIWAVLGAQMGFTWALSGAQMGYVWTLSGRYVVS